MPLFRRALGKTRKELRGLGSFDSVEQAEQAVAAAYAALSAGEDPFKQEVVVQRQARGQVRSHTSPVKVGLGTLRPPRWGESGARGDCAF